MILLVVMQHSQNEDPDVVLSKFKKITPHEFEATTLKRMREKLEKHEKWVSAESEKKLQIEAKIMSEMKEKEASLRNSHDIRNGIIQRLDDYIRDKDQKLEKERRTQAEKQRKNQESECTFKPITNSQSKSLHRTVDDMLAWKAEKDKQRINKGLETGSNSFKSNRKTVSLRHVRVSHKEPEFQQHNKTTHEGNLKANIHKAVERLYTNALNRSNRINEKAKSKSKEVKVRAGSQGMRKSLKVWTAGAEKEAGSHNFIKTEAFMRNDEQSNEYPQAAGATKMAEFHLELQKIIEKMKDEPTPAMNSDRFGKKKAPERVESQSPRIDSPRGQPDTVRKSPANDIPLILPQPAAASTKGVIQESEVKEEASKTKQKPRTPPKHTEEPKASPESSNLKSQKKQEGGAKTDQKPAQNEKVTKQESKSVKKTETPSPISQKTQKQSNTKATANTKAFDESPKHHSKTTARPIEGEKSAGKHASNTKGSGPNSRKQSSSKKTEQSTVKKSPSPKLKPKLPDHQSPKLPIKSRVTPSKASQPRNSSKGARSRGSLTPEPRKAPNPAPSIPASPDNQRTESEVTVKDHRRKRTDRQKGKQEEKEDCDGLKEIAVGEVFLSPVGRSSEGFSLKYSSPSSVSAKQNQTKDQLANQKMTKEIIKDDSEPRTSLGHDLTPTLQESVIIHETKVYDIPVPKPPKSRSGSKISPRPKETHQDHTEPKDFIKIDSLRSSEEHQESKRRPQKPGSTDNKSGPNAGSWQNLANPEEKIIKERIEELFHRKDTIKQKIKARNQLDETPNEKAPVPYPYDPNGTVIVHSDVDENEDGFS